MAHATHTNSNHSPTLLPSISEEQKPIDTEGSSAVLHRSLKIKPLQVVSAKGSYVKFSNGHTMLDSTGGAGVACIGYNNERVKKAMMDQIDKFSYCNSMFFGTPIGEELAKELIRGTGGKMANALICCSGSEAMEDAMKMARQYYVEIDQPKRVKFIARHGSYHGTTLGSLSMSGHMQRRGLFENTGMLLPNIGRVSPCYAYRGMRDGETNEQYVERLADELDRKFQEMDPETVCAFVAEPTVGATLGCVPAVPGYFKAMKKVCEKYGALIILDEVMSGMGRSGTLHAWFQEGIVPDIQTIAKCLGGGYASVAGIIINHRVADALRAGTGAFANGHTYQGHPVGCAAALEVQRIVREGNLVENVQKMGKLLSDGLHQILDSHPYVGNIRGKGLFWGIEFVQDKATKEPFPRSMDIANKVHTVALHEFGLSMYPGTGTKDGNLGDHVLLCPAYNSTPEEIEEIIRRTKQTIDRAFADVQSNEKGVVQRSRL